MMILYESDSVYSGDVPSKIFVLCQLNLLSNPNFDQANSNKSFKMVISLLRMRWERVQEQAETRNVDQDDSSEVDTNSQEEPQDATFYKLLMTPYRQPDELAYFQQIIRGLRAN